MFSVTSPTTGTETTSRRGSNRRSKLIAKTELASGAGLERRVALEAVRELLTSPNSKTVRALRRELDDTRRIRITSTELSDLVSEMLGCDPFPSGTASKSAPGGQVRGRNERGGPETSSIEFVGAGVTDGALHSLQGSGRARGERGAARGERGAARGGEGLGRSGATCAVYRWLAGLFRNASQRDFNPRYGLEAP